MPPTVTESVVEQVALDWFKELGYSVLFGPDITPAEPAAERATFGDAVLVERLRAALARINPTIPADALEEVVRKVVNAGHASPSLFENNRRFHRLLVEGVDVEYSDRDGRIVHDKAWLIDWHDKPGKNDWLVVNQFTVIEERGFPAKASTPAAISESRLQPERYNNRRPDVVVFINGLPLGVIELKNPADENATLTGAFKQLQTYKHDIPSLFPYNELLVISDGVYARVGTLAADWERFMPWRTVEGDTVAPKGSLELEVLVKGVLYKSRLLDLIQNFIVFETDAERIVKKMAGYHQFHAVNKVVESTVRAASLRGDRRVGVVCRHGTSKPVSHMSRTIARELVETVRRNTTIDWTVRESVRAKLRTLVKRILRKYGYPPDKQEKATLTVIAQAELIAKDWVG